MGIGLSQNSISAKRAASTQANCFKLRGNLWTVKYTDIKGRVQAIVQMHPPI